ncbi:hypothetical protein AGABI1DRAFT_128348 [Agaricus bisporus var. burnettii JB137-S8]|uniref:Uncharacterized protein n=1 Tax=Agaricus bisporus var. burnettii (strain JB137-S8 / ATCC MYA-4627 / FGSC 10392) TaxID=597362 RepID=K5WUR6_AGABU|nr:uncharacterized protein AGABI1DRAFT_128348 [Agaricus bisporus var. burnettii JB137-S8]EKM79186.1 hypothetical protein AGABI1DRAFT_128348 [Agaricus bisporus var. burnettii JB137-S8]
MITSDRDLSGINCIDDTVCRNDPGSGLCIETATFGFLASIYRTMNLSTFVLFELLLGIRFSNAIPVGPLEEPDVEGRSTLSLLSVLSVFIVCCVAVLYYNWLRNPFTSLRRRAFSFHLGGYFIPRVVDEGEGISRGRSNPAFQPSSPPADTFHLPPSPAAPVFRLPTLPAVALTNRPKSSFVLS